MSNIATPTMQELLEAGSHFGHKVSRGHPRMKRYIYGARDGVHILDLAQTEEKLKEATEAAYELGKNGKSLLIVGTKKQSREIVQQLAEQAEAYFINERWMGGLLTNFDEIKKNIKKLTELRELQSKGQLQRTKKEQLLISKKLGKFGRELGGMSNMEKLPDAIFVIDGVGEKIAVTEANKVGMKVFGICDTNADPTQYDFPVPANDDGIKSIKLITETVIGAYIKGKKEAGIKAQEIAEKAEADLKKEEAKTKKQAEKDTEKTDIVGGAIAEEAAALEEEVEKEVLEESERKV